LVLLTSQIDLKVSPFSSLRNGHPISGGVTASTEMLAARRHAGVLTPVIVGKTIIANQQMAYAA
jgi:hypothetical protein